MSGDHNMNQFTYGKAIIGGEHNITQKQDIDLPPVASPLGLSINQYRQQTTAVIDDLAHIIESLEI